MKLSTRALVEGALMSALCVILSLMGLIPVIGAVTMFFYGIPISIITIRHGKFPGGLSAILSVLIIALFLGPISAVLNGLEGILLGYVIGLMIHNRKSGEKTVGIVLAVTAFSAVIVLIINLFLLGFSPTNMTEFMENYKAEMIESYNEMGMMELMEQSMLQQGISQEDLDATIQNALLLSMKTLPAMTVVGRMAIAMVTYFATLALLKRLKIKIPRMPRADRIRLPFPTIWAIIAVWALWLLSTYVAVPALSILALNLMIIFAVLLFVEGISFTCYWLQPQKMTWFAKIGILMITIACFSGVLLGMIFVGLGDLLFDFRKKIGDNKK